MVTIKADAPIVAIITTKPWFLTAGPRVHTRSVHQVDNVASTFVSAVQYADPHWADGAVYEVDCDVYDTETGRWIDGEGTWHTGMVSAVLGYIDMLQAARDAYGITL